MSEESVEFKYVSREEFKAFIEAYPNPLERDVFGACEPPMVTWNDFKRAPYWPDSIVARASGDNLSVICDINSPVPDDGKRETDEPLLDKNGVRVTEGDRIRAYWGWSSTTSHNYRESTAIVRDKGTKYECWSFDDCHNRLRGSDFEIISKQSNTSEES